VSVEVKAHEVRDMAIATKTTPAHVANGMLPTRFIGAEFLQEFGRQLRQTRLAVGLLVRVFVVGH
jgi:hypothetical protein